MSRWAIVASVEGRIVGTYGPFESAVAAYSWRNARKAQGFRFMLEVVQLDAPKGEREVVSVDIKEVAS